MLVDLSALSDPTLYLPLRFLKILCVLAFSAGCVGALLVHALEDRKRLVFYLAGPAFGGTWLFGFLLAGVLHAPLLSTWVVGSMFLSFVALQGALYAASRDHRRNWVAAWLVLGPLLGTLALMVWRPA